MNTMLDYNWLDYDDNCYGNTIGTWPYRYFDGTGQWLMTQWIFSMTIMAISLGGRMFTYFAISFHGCNNWSRQHFGFNTMALIVMLHHYLMGTFGLFWIVLVCWCQFFVDVNLIVGLLIDYDVMMIWWLGLIMIWWLGLMIMIWLQWFEDDDNMMNMLTNNMLMPRFNSLRLASTEFTSRIDIILMAFTIGFVFYLS